MTKNHLTKGIYTLFLLLFVLLSSCAVTSIVHQPKIIDQTSPISVAAIEVLKERLINNLINESLDLDSPQRVKILTAISRNDYIDVLLKISAGLSLFINDYANAGKPDIVLAVAMIGDIIASNSSSFSVNGNGSKVEFETPVELSIDDTVTCTIGNAAIESLDGKISLEVNLVCNGHNAKLAFKKLDDNIFAEFRSNGQSIGRETSIEIEGLANGGQVLITSFESNDNSTDSEVTLEIEIPVGIPFDVLAEKNLATGGSKTVSVFAGMIQKIGSSRVDSKPIAKFIHIQPEPGVLSDIELHLLDLAKGLAVTTQRLDGMKGDGNTADIPLAAAAHLRKAYFIQVDPLNSGSVQLEVPFEIRLDEGPTYQALLVEANKTTENIILKANLNRLEDGTGAHIATVSTPDGSGSVEYMYSSPSDSVSFKDVLKGFVSEQGLFVTEAVFEYKSPVMTIEKKIKSVAGIPETEYLKNFLATGKGISVQQIVDLLSE
jgi:hypothetical protein